jgi:hypothetical protein
MRCQWLPNQIALSDDTHRFSVKIVQIVLFQERHSGLGGCSEKIYRSKTIHPINHPSHCVNILTRMDVLGDFGGIASQWIRQGELDDDSDTSWISIEKFD